MEMLLLVLLVSGFIKVETMMEGTKDQLKELFEDEII